MSVETMAIPYPIINGIYWFKNTSLTISDYFCLIHFEFDWLTKSVDDLRNLPISLWPESQNILSAYIEIERYKSTNSAWARCVYSLTMACVVAV